MKRLMCGIAIGLTLGVACSANATNFYYTAADLLSTSTMTQRGYVMGMRDTLAALATNDEAQSAAEDTMRCMDRFENAEALRLWAVRRLNAEADPDRNAAADTLMVYKRAHPCGF